jgi:hypothetical protein
MHRRLGRKGPHQRPESRADHEQERSRSSEEAVNDDRGPDEVAGPPVRAVEQGLGVEANRQGERLGQKEHAEPGAAHEVGLSKTNRTCQQE